MIYNASAYKQEKDPLVRSILYFINTNDPGQDTFANRLSSLVETLKERDTFRQEYSAVNLHDRDLIRMAKKEGVLEGIEQGVKQGIQQGQAQAKLESAITAVNFFNVTPQIAAEKMGVPLEELQKALKES